MRSRSSPRAEVAEAARRRLDLLAEELAGLRQEGATPAHPSQQPGVQVGGLPEPRQQRPRPGRHALRPLGTSDVVGGWLHDRLPVSLQDRGRLTSTHLTVVALLIAGALAATSWWVLRADGVGTVVSDAPARRSATGVPALVPVSESSFGASTTSSPHASPSGVVVIDVAGKVRDPGIATLPLGSRVVDAIKAAGGARRGVDLSALNLARLLVDGEQILVGVPPAVGVAASAASAPGAGVGTSGPLVNLNTATQAELESLPGVGPVTATAILKWRSENGAFTAVDELLEISGIGDATLAEIAPFVTL